MTIQGHRPRTCECGHTIGEHKSSGAGWPHPLLYGLCLVQGCDCVEYREVRR